VTIRLLYIGGYSRSGSTLLLRLLGEVPGMLAVGELFDLWQRSYIENQLCGCGEVFRDCSFWQEVTVKAFGSGPEDVDSNGMQELRKRVQGYPRIPQLWMPPLRGKSYNEQLHNYAEILSRFYKAISAVSGARYIVDSSKVPQFAWLLGEMPDTELHMVHLVRDSRATAYSWQRQRVRPEIAWKVQHMDRHSVVRSALEWDTFNLMLRSRRRSMASYTLIRYEDLVANPAAQLARIGSALGDELDRYKIATNGTSHLRVSHTASGNPSRFKSGQTVIGLDDEWTKSMEPAQRRIVSILTAGGLARYGYFRRR
jgi:Sulfotransferase family